ncbi:MAG: hypothetical protein JW841_13975 [Deltaproteobacteria bacterium]|nr:hypothetical protein [Deltaproteobacteria bacterium]
MDEVFGYDNLVNEIVWQRAFGHSDSQRYGVNTDSILFYAQSEKWSWNQSHLPYDVNYVERFRKCDTDGHRWMDDNLTAYGLSGGGYEYFYKGVFGYW